MIKSTLAALVTPAPSPVPHIFIGKFFQYGSPLLLSHAEWCRIDKVLYQSTEILFGYENSKAKLKTEYLCLCEFKIFSQGS